MSLRLIFLLSLVLGGCAATTSPDSAFGSSQRPPFPVEFHARLRVVNGVFEAYNHELYKQYLKNGCINVLFDEKSNLKVQHEFGYYFDRDQNDFNLVGEIYSYQDVLLGSLNEGAITNSPAFTCNENFILVVRDLFPRG